jgi:transcriptional regulator with XRE-family HTH domain
MADSTDPIMVKLQELFKRSDLTLEEIGKRMGYTEKMARISLWQFLNKTADPRLSMVRKFAAAVGVPLSKLFKDDEPPNKPRRKKNG